jgi:ankyrin repeat protein
VVDVIARLLDAGADPNQRGINDWTALMMAVVETNVEAVRLLLARGADPALRTASTTTRRARARDARAASASPREAALAESMLQVVEHT